MEGRFMSLKMDDKFVACETSCDLAFENELLPASAVTSGRWKEFIDGVRGWSITVNANTVLGSVNAADFPYVLQKFIEGGIIQIAFTTTQTYGEMLVITGEALIRSGGISAPSAGSSTWMLTLQGTSALFYNYDPFGGLIINTMPIEADPDLTVDTTDW